MRGHMRNCQISRSLYINKNGHSADAGKSVSVPTCIDGVFILVLVASAVSLVAVLGLASRRPGAVEGESVGATVVAGD